MSMTVRSGPPTGSSLVLRRETDFGLNQQSTAPLYLLGEPLLDYLAARDAGQRRIAQTATDAASQREAARLQALRDAQWRVAPPGPQGEATILAEPGVRRSQERQLQQLGKLGGLATGIIISCDSSPDNESYAKRLIKHSEEIGGTVLEATIETLAHSLQSTSVAGGFRTIMLRCSPQEAAAAAKRLGKTRSVDSILLMTPTEQQDDIIANIPHAKDVDCLRTPNRRTRVGRWLKSIVLGKLPDMQLTPQAMVRLWEDDAGIPITDIDPSRIAIIGGGRIARGVHEVLRRRGVVAGHAFRTVEQVKAAPNTLAFTATQAVFIAIRAGGIYKGGDFKAPAGGVTRIIDATYGPKERDATKMGGSVDPDLAQPEDRVRVSSFYGGVGWVTADMWAQYTIDRATRRGRSARVRRRIVEFFSARRGTKATQEAPAAAPGDDIPAPELSHV